jgi:hypothetical protein
MPVTGLLNLIITTILKSKIICEVIVNQASNLQTVPVVNMCLIVKITEKLHVKEKK